MVRTESEWWAPGPRRGGGRPRPDL